MEWADLLPIGRFSQLSRLSLKALRLYDQMGLMRPAYVDPESGYRYYSMSQAREAQLIRLLRRLDMPLSDIRQVLGTSDPHKRAALLDTYWSGVEARVVEGRQTVTRLHQLLNRRLLTMQESSLPLYLLVRADAEHPPQSRANNGCGRLSVGVAGTRRPACRPQYVGASCRTG
jgi:DNA-binding transcriptional MerR regulator